MNTIIIPESFLAKENKLKHKMKLFFLDEEDNKNHFASIKQEKTNGVLTFKLCDDKKNAVAIAYKKYFEYGSLIEIFDMFGGLMGSIQHVVLNPMKEPLQKYIIFDGFGKLIAETRQQCEIQKFISLFNQEEKKVLSMRKGMNKMFDKWEVNIGEYLDKRLAIFLPIFVSSQLGKQMI